MRRAKAPNEISVRRGVALVILLAVLSVIALFMATITAQILANRRTLDRRGQQLQAAWLARAGIELACSRLLADPAKYIGESVELMPNSRLQIQVRPDPKSADAFLVTSEARYPVETSHGVTRSLTRRVRRAADGVHVRVEAQPVDSR